MKYLFCGHMFNDAEGDIKKMRTPPPVSSHKYQEGMLRGLVENEQEVVVVNIPRVRYFPHYPQIVFKHSKFYGVENVDGINIGFINLPIVNYITQSFMLKRELQTLVDDKDPCVLISFNNYLPQNRAMVALRSKCKNALICNVLGDLHGTYGVQFADRYRGLKGKLIKRIEASQDRLSAQSDAFGFLTAAMAEALGVGGRPYVVIEGMYSSDVVALNNRDSDVFSIFYAGAIAEEYGMLHLLKAFALIDDNRYRLQIAGSGGAVEIVKQYAKRDKRISYLGYISPEEVKEYQANATCLVNPRTSNRDYVKYSFPSKSMECLASGKPYVAHFLPCYPAEYRQYIQCPKDESDAALAQELIRVCSLSASERNAIGDAAQAFIANEKNPRTQCRKIVEMMNELAGGVEC